MNWRDRMVLYRFAFWDHEIDDRSIKGRRHLVDRLERTCRDERALGLTTAWTYDLAMHKSLYRILDREAAFLAAMESSEEDAAMPIAAE